MDKLRPMSDILAIRANNSGRLQLSISTEGVKVDTDWKDCTNPKSEIVSSATAIRVAPHFTPRSSGRGTTRHG